MVLGCVCGESRHWAFLYKSFHSLSSTFHPNSHRQSNLNSSLCIGGNWGRETWMTCSRVLSCWGTELELDPRCPDSWPRPFVSCSSHDYFTCACLVSLHRLMPSPLSWSSFLSSAAPCHAEPRAGGQSLSQLCWGLSVCTVHPSKCWRRYQRSPVSPGFAGGNSFSQSAIWETCIFLLNCAHLFWTGNWHPSYRAVNPAPHRSATCTSQHPSHGWQVTESRWA